MRFLRSYHRLSILVACALLAGGCGDRDAEAKLGPASDGSDHGQQEFFNPRKGETWKYKVQREVPFEVALSIEDTARRPERTESGHLITFERVRVCSGTSRPKGADKQLTTMEVFENGVLLGQELYDVAPDGIFSKGWIAAHETASEELLDRGIALARPRMQPGEIWEGTGRDPSRRFHFRVIERTTVRVPAGSFEASRIQITMDHQNRSLKRTIWFVDKVGIVKEESVAYGPERTRVRERSELMHWVVPSDSPPDQKQPVSTPGKREPSDRQKPR